MKVAMAALGFGALFIGLLQVPGVDHVLTTFLAGTFEESPLFHIEPTVGDSWLGLAVGGSISVIGVLGAYICYVRRPGVTVRLAERYRRLHAFLFNKWYFDELIDALVYRPAIATGRFANSVFERYVVDGIVAGATGLVKGAGSVVRGAQSGLVRGYALLLVGGFAALGIYFLVVAKLMLNVLLWTPLAAGLIALAVPRTASRWVAALGALVTLVVAIALVADFDPAATGLQQVVDESWIPDLGVRYQLGVDGISVFLVLMTAALWFAVTLWSALRNEPGDGRAKLYYFLVGLAGTAALGAFTAQDLLLFVLFFDLMLIPFFFLIGAFGGVNRVAATTKMIVFTLVGSLLMLVGGDRDRGARLRYQRRAHLLDPGAAARPCSRTATRRGSSASSPPPSWSRCPPSRSTAGCPTPTGRRRCRC